MISMIIILYDDLGVAILFRFSVKAQTIDYNYENLIRKNIEMSEKYEEMIKRAATAKKKELEERKEKCIEKATEIIMDKMHKESGIHGQPC